MTPGAAGGDISIPWAIAVGLGFPLALLILNEWIARSGRRGGVLTSTLAASRNFLLPALGVALMTRYVLGVAPGHTADLVVQTVFWIVLLFVALSFLNDVIFGSAREGSWRANVPELLRDVVRSLLVGLGAAFIYSQIWGKELAGALTALGVGSLVIGLALQEPLGNVFSGIMLLFERPVAAGDWIKVGEDTGRVFTMNWRAVNIETITRAVVVVPNSSLYKTSFTNLSRPTPIRTEVIEFGFSYDDPPNKVKAVLLDLLKETPGVLAEPAPVVRTHKYDAYSIVYQAFFSVRDMEAMHGVRDEVLTRAYYVARRAGLTIPFPTSVELAEDAQRLQQQRAIDPRAVLARHPQFELPETGSPGMDILEFARGELLLKEGDEQDGLCLLIEGRAVLIAHAADGAEKEIGVLGPGDFYGEHSVLAGQASQSALRALSDARVLRFDLETSRRLVEHSTRLARTVGETIDQRRRAVQAVRRRA